MSLSASFDHWTVYLLVATASLTVASIFLKLYDTRRRRNQNRNEQLLFEYGLFHLALNRLPGQPVGAPPDTEWLNMGYWKHDAVFPRACQALASKLISTASLKSGANVLDVGFGTGESLLHLLSSPSIPQPIKLTGITDMRSHCERAQKRILTRFPELEERVSLITTDAISDGSPDHPLSPSSNSPPFNAILALDCAYHFNTRQKFLEQSFARLTSGGRIALADICFSEAYLQSFASRFVTKSIRMMPLCNRISVDEYRRQMEEAGYTDVKIEDITADVFPAFISFLKRQGLAWWLFGVLLHIYTNSGGAHYVIVSGQKP